MSPLRVQPVIEFVVACAVGVVAVKRPAQRIELDVLIYGVPFVVAQHAVMKVALPEFAGDDAKCARTFCDGGLEGTNDRAERTRNNTVRA